MGTAADGERRGTMSERSRRGTGGVSPTRPQRPDHRKGKQPIGLYAAAAVILLLVAAGAVWAVIVVRGALAPKPPSKPVAVTTPSPGPPSVPPSAPPLPPSVSAESAAAVKAAALPFPNPPAVTPETIRGAQPSRRLVAITFDDDGGPFDTRILDLLERQNVRCTTFVLGRTVKSQPEIVKRLNGDGFEIANHTWDGKNLMKLADSEIRSELTQCQDRISAITGNQAPYMRPPGGATNSRVERVAASIGFRVVLWSRASDDTSASATPQSISHAVMDGLKPGEIILMHWSGKSTYQALQLILPEMEKHGLTPVTLSELLKYSSTAAGAKAKQGRGEAGVPGPARAAEAAEATPSPAPRARARPITSAPVPAFEK